MTLYHMPIYRKLQEKLDTGALGELRLIQMNFGSYKPYDMSNRFFNRNLAGGALLDIGVYALSFVRWFMTSAPGRGRLPGAVCPHGRGRAAGILLKNKEQEMASVILSLHAKQPKRGTVAFDKGYVEFYDYPRGQEAVITYTEDGSKETLRGGSTADALLYEVEDMERAVGRAGHDAPGLHPRRHAHHDRHPPPVGHDLPGGGISDGTGRSHHRVLGFRKDNFFA